MTHQKPVLSSQRARRDADTQDACPGCGACQCDHNGHGESVVAGLKGWRLVATTIGLFLVPLVLATVAATVFRANVTTQLIATIGALAVGMGATLMAARRLHGAGAAGREQS